MKNGSSTKNPRSGKTPEIKAWVMPFANPKERKEFLMNFAVSSEFEMRYRGLVHFYGKDLVTYKRLYPANKKCNEFLRVFAKFMTDFLEDHCPPSWKECQSSVWEELIYTCFPHYMKISHNEKEVESFLNQLKKFVSWIDRREGTSWYSVVENLAEEAISDLKICEHLLNALLLASFPKLYDDDFDPLKDMNKLQQKFDQCTDSLNSLYEVTSIIEDVVVLTEFNTNRTYYLKELPYKFIKPGIIMNGVIGRRNGEKFWKWYQTEGIYPKKGRQYLALNN